jgi:hypothetical protein
MLQNVGTVRSYDPACELVQLNVWSSLLFALLHLAAQELLQHIKVNLSLS